MPAKTGGGGGEQLAWRRSHLVLELRRRGDGARASRRSPAATKDL
jgi:hypothetical protein